MVMTNVSKATPVSAADMGRKEAEEVTQAIKNNFDSLGAMLVQARDRKAYKALGYRSFESYCQNEFGRSVSSAYQIIEDARVLSQLEAKISENYGEEVTLKIPASHLRPLKAVTSIDDKLKAIEYANKLAAGEGKKPTKQHLEIAVFEVSGKRSEEFKAAIEKLGFTKGAQVESVSPIKKDRGIIKSIDKAGLIYVEHYYGGNKAISYHTTELRLLTNEEKPTNPLEGSVATKGDRVLIFAEGLQGKQGTIYIWKEGKTTLVMVDGQDSPTVIAYAEMELIKSEQKKADWQSELVWQEGKNTYHYSPQHQIIYNDQWPHDLSLQADTQKENPVKFIQDWESEFADGLLKALATPARVKTLVIAQVIELPVDEGKKFATDLIDCLQQFLPQQKDTTKTRSLLQENEQLRQQLSEAEVTIQSMVAASISSSPGEAETHSEFLAENRIEEILTPGEPASESDFLGENDTENSSPGDTVELSPEVWERLKNEQDKVNNCLEKNRAKKYDFCGHSGHKMNKKEIDRLDREIDDQYGKLEQLKKFSQLKVGQTICHKREPLILGKIIKLEFSQGGMPLVWVKYYRDGELEKNPNSELVNMIFIVETFGK